MIDIAIAGRCGQPQVGAAREQHIERDFQLQPGQWCADAEMDAAAKAGVLRAATGRIEPRGIGIDRRIAVCRPQQAGDLVAALKRWSPICTSS